ncbi:MAG: hypothetical protein LBI04_01845, partial [Treponema sp.]|nr:hypothetical protein [Treponema sp.]
MAGFFTAFFAAGFFTAFFAAGFFAAGFFAAGFFADVTAIFLSPFKDFFPPILTLAVVGLPVFADSPPVIFTPEFFI